MWQRPQNRGNVAPLNCNINVMSQYHRVDPVAAPVMIARRNGSELHCLIPQALIIIIIEGR